MNILSVLTMFGGLALFLFGMDTMGKALEKLAGGKLHAILKRLTSNPVNGFLLGTVVTAIIQSSSATTVLVVGFVNSGVMQLGQAVGVIMGANVGTTVTSWLLSLTGLTGDSLIVSLLKPASFSPVLAMIGVVLRMWSRDEHKRDAGTILLGFAVLMTGMNIMSEVVKPLADVPAFTELFLMFSNPVLGVLAGAFLTAVIQSSSASVGILQALSATGAISVSSAVPIILGQNIGTCVTALISAIGANKSARRAAVVHLYFNLIGSALFLIVYLAVCALFRPALVAQPINGFGIAVVHTAFNLLSTAVMLPFTRQLEKLACLTVPGDKEREPVCLLDERLLATPALAVEQSRSNVLKMAEEAHQSLISAIRMTHRYDAKTAETVMNQEKDVDHYEDVLGTYLVHLSSRSMTMEESREVSGMLHVIGDLERLSDHAVNITETAREMADKGVTFSELAWREVNTLTDAVQEILDITLTAYEKRDMMLAAEVEPLEQVIDSLTQEIRSRHIARLRDGACTIELGFILTDLLGNFERVSDHCSNIAVAMIELARDSFDTHEYLNYLKDTGAQHFRERYEDYRAKYHLC